MIRSYFKLLSFVCCAVVALTSSAQEKLIILNEGLWQSDNGKISYFEDGKVISNQWFRDINGYKLGDTPNDIIQANDTLIAIAVNWSNIVQFIRRDGRAVKATEDIPNNRKLASDGQYVYVSSYGHECMVNGSIRHFNKGYVAKIDLSTFKVVDAVEVGYEPEGIALYKGCLFVANTGGYAFQEDHEYERTVNVINSETLEIKRTIDTGQINLYGKMSQSGRYLCINSPGDYYDVPAATIIMDCEAALEGKPDSECFVKLDYASTYNCTDMDGNFYAIGSRYSYYTGQYTFNYIVINPEQAIKTGGRRGISDNMPGTLSADIKDMAMPYGIYMNPYSGYFYATDAGAFTEAGILYQWDQDGHLLGKHKLYINPAHFLALDPDWEEPGSGVIGIHEDSDIKDNIIYNLQGIPVMNPTEGSIYIRNGKKIIFRKQ